MFEKSQHHIEFKDIKGSGHLIDVMLHKITRNADLTTPYARCLIAVLQAQEWEGELWHITQAFPHFGDHFGLFECINTLAYLGYHSKPLDGIILKNIETRLIPFLFVPDLAPHCPMVVLSKNNDMLEVFDSRQNKIIIISADSSIKGTAYFFTKLADTEHHVDRLSHFVDKDPWVWFMHLLRRQKDILKQILSLSFFINLLAIVSSIFIMVVYDRVISVNAWDTLAYLTLGALLSVGIDLILRNIRSNLFAWYGTRLDAIVSPTIFGRILHLSPRYTESASTASQIARIRDFDIVREFFSGSLAITLVEIPFTLILLLTIWIVGGDIVIVPIVLMLVYVLLYHRVKPKITGLIEESSRLNARKHSFNVETIGKIRTIKTLGSGERWHEQYRIISGAASMSNFRSNFYTSIIECIAYSLYVIAGILTLALGVHLVIEGKMSMGALVACMILVWRILSPLQSIFTSTPIIIHLIQSVKQAHQLMLLKPEQEPTYHNVKTVALEGDITLSNIMLRFQQAIEPLFLGLNLTIKQGEVFAITGRNGSGKSTLLKLINGLYLPVGGAVRIRNIDIRQVNIHELRRSIAYVPQKVELFHGTLYQNLRLGVAHATDQAIEDILTELGCFESVMKLPGGLHYRVGDHRSEQLSLTLAYQLTLARALLKESKIVLIDEAPTSFVHGIQHQKFMDYVIKYKGQKTFICVAQHPEYFKNADKAVYLYGDGRAIAGASADIMDALKRQGVV